MRHSWWGVVFLVVLVGCIYLLDAVLMPFIAGLILAYLADPLANYFQRLGMKRPWAVSSVFFVLLLILSLSLLILIPLVVQQTKQLGEALPSVFNWIENILAPQVQEWTGYDLGAELTNVRETLIKNWRDAGSYAAQALSQIGRSGVAFISWVTYVALIPVVTFYLLLDWSRLISSLADLVPRQWKSDVDRLAQRCDEVLSAFLRGQLLVMLCLGIIYAAGLTLMGLNFGLLIGVVSGLVSIVPFLGFIVGLVVALIVALFQFDTWWAVLGVIAVFGIGQAAESVILQPKLLGDKIGLHPVAVIFAVLAGGDLFGLTGVLLALPVAAIIMVLLREIKDRYKGSALYDAEQRPIEQQHDNDGLGRHDERESP
ncbi:AI-2E family transporter [Vreelandella venusta]|uniref:AI-2E family transporter n=1 Tax=Vreelandella venusta TaxID=44935 RepID=A0AAP9ZFM0_9GAMM|nr:AI-2E family transporter [Halomonas venusta]MBR9926605.1 AI-2E family transporter [Gammaproteobacteria bacterium]MDW0361420.1 AI-2E family transporter [Halomonas venusta]MDX1355969.1 AI-2E family transporter [Halomonas venusta]QPI65720.1 AI-2E family transporter [Halomonas venusta]QRL04891.1 AI-2E family transporter [Halomonas venusta]